MRIHVLGMGSSITIGPSGPLVAGGVVFATGPASIATEATVFFWDETNNRLGLGTNAPSTLLHVAGAATITGGLQFGTSQAINSTTSRLEQIGATTFGTWEANKFTLETDNSTGDSFGSLIARGTGGQARPSIALKPGPTANAASRAWAVGINRITLGDMTVRISTSSTGEPTTNVFAFQSTQIIPAVDNAVALGIAAKRWSTINAARYDSGASTGFTGTVAPPATITVVGGIVTNVA